MEPMEQMEHCDGNTISSQYKARNWCFTLNNWSNEEFEDLKRYLEQNNAYFIIGKEIASTGTPHLQGYLQFKNPRAFSSIKKINHRIHWSKAYGNKEANIKYCSKDNEYITNFPESKQSRILKKYENVIWKPWQQEIIDKLKNEADSRSIIWVYDEEGNKGKSFLCKYLYNKYNCIIATGKANDIFNQCAVWQSANEDKDPELILVDVPRSNMEYLSYLSIEKLKDGLLYSGKYEGSVIQFVENVHIVIFSNELPKNGKMSKDRYIIYKI